MKKKLLVALVLLVAFVLAVILGSQTTVFASEEEYTVYEQHGILYATKGEQNTAGFEKYVEIGEISRTVTYARGQWIAHNGYEIFKAGLDVITIDGQQFIHIDDWAYFELYHMLPIRITYDYYKYLKTGELVVMTWDDSNLKIIYSQQDAEPVTLAVK